ncbi:MAG TPA: hypothetical protein VKF40_11955 [Burkholderiales bacterium]|nr:hypothetical protein [Burkholderiales bacterium]
MCDLDHVVQGGTLHQHMYFDGTRYRCCVARRATRRLLAGDTLRANP